MQFLETEFLPYLSAWEESVKKRTGFDEDQLKRMLLSQETLLGLRITSELAMIILGNSYNIFTIICSSLIC